MQCWKEKASDVREVILVIFVYMETIVAPQKEPVDKKGEEAKFTSSRSSWGGAQPGCWARHHPGQW